MDRSAYDDHHHYDHYLHEGREKRPSALWDDIDGNKKASIELKETFRHLLICLNPKIQQETIKKLKFEENDIFVCLDSALTDQDKMRLGDVCNLKTI